MLAIALLVIAALLLYFIPSIFAIKKEKANAGAIVVLNVFLGWTFAGWLAALLWSLTNNGCRSTNAEVLNGKLAGTLGLCLILPICSLVIFGISAMLIESEKNKEYQTTENHPSTYVADSASGIDEDNSNYPYLKKDYSRLRDSSSSNTNQNDIDPFANPAGSNSNPGTSNDPSSFNDNAPNEDPSVTAIRDRLQSYVNKVDQLNGVIKEHERIESRLKIEIQEKEAQILLEKAHAKKLENNLLVANNIIEHREKNKSEEASPSFDPSSGSRVDETTGTSYDTEQDIMNVVWPNLPNFHPGRYRTDIEKRLLRNAHVMKIHAHDVSLQFAINKIGVPVRIDVINPELDDETRKRCVAYVRAAGPFRPLLGPIEEMKVEAKLSQGSTVNLSDLSISAQGNRL